MSNRGHRRSHVPRVGPLVDIHWLAKRWQRSYRSALHLVKRLIKSDVEKPIDPACVWWIGFDVRNALKLVNLLKLRAAHPALFARNFVSRDEHDDLLTRVVRLEERLGVMQKRYRSLAARKPPEPPRDDDTGDVCTVCGEPVPSDGLGCKHARDGVHIITITADELMPRRAGTG